MKLQYSNDPDKVGPGKHRSLLLAFWFDGKIFFVVLQSVFASKKKKKKKKKKVAKRSRHNLYVSYYEWTLEIMKIQQEVTFKHYNYLEEMLN